MAIPFGANIELLSEVPNFTRDMFATKAEMKAFAEYKLPPIFITTCKEDGNIYVYNKNNTVDSVTGKWRSINASGSSSYEDLTNKPAIEGVVLNKNTTIDGLNLYSKESINGFLKNKVDVVEGKQLTTEDFTTAEKEKLGKIPEDAEANIQADWNQTDDEAKDFIKNKPVLFSGDYKDLANKPINLSDFNNDKDFVTSLADNLKNYYLKNESYSKDEIDSKIGAIATLSMLIVDELPEEGSSKIIYLIKKTGTAGYIEYIYTLGEWADIGDTDVDLSEYVKEVDLATVAKSGSYKDLTDKPQIPEKISDLTDDVGIIQIDDMNKSADTVYSSQKVEALFANLTGTALEQEVTSSVAVGGINEGDVFEVGTTLTQLFVKMLEKYVAPVISIATTPATSLYKKGNSVNSITITATVTKKSEAIEKVEFLVGSSVVETVTEGVEKGGTFTYTYDIPFTTNTKFTVRCNDVDTQTSKTADKTISFAIPYYYGVIDGNTLSTLDGLTEDLSTKGTKKYAFTADNKYVVIAYDASYADLTSILDQNNFENKDDFTKKTVTIGDYSLKYYVSNGPKTISNFKYTFA